MAAITGYDKARVYLANKNGNPPFQNELDATFLVGKVELLREGNRIIEIQVWTGGDKPIIVAAHEFTAVVPVTTLEDKASTADFLSRRGILSGQE